MTSENAVREPIRFAVNVARIPQGGLAIDFVADEKQRLALAERLGILSVRRLSARLAARHWRAEGIAIEGRINAEVEQESVVTLAPVRQVIDDPFQMTFVPDDSAMARLARPDEIELQIDPEAEDPPEMFFGSVIDLGPYLSEAVALGLDPYPRERDAVFTPVDTDPEPPEAEPSPFSVLVDLQAKRAAKDDPESK